MTMTEEEIKLEKELLKQGAKMCKGKELCEDCPKKEEFKQYAFGCFEYAALKMILGLIKEKDKLQKEVEKSFVLDITSAQKREFISRCEELDAEPEEILSELVRCLAYEGNGSDERELAERWFDRESANYELF